MFRISMMAEQAIQGNKQKLGTSNFEMSVFQAAQYFRVKLGSKPREKKNNCVSGQAKRFKQRNIFQRDMIFGLGLS